MATSSDDPKIPKSSDSTNDEGRAEELLFDAAAPADLMPPVVPTQPISRPVTAHTSGSKPSVVDTSKSKSISLPRRLMQWVLGTETEPLPASTEASISGKSSQTSSDFDALNARAKKTLSNPSAFTKPADMSDGSTSENSDLAFSAQDTSDAMKDKLKQARGTLEDLEFSGTTTPMRDPSDKTPRLPLTPQKSAQEESASPIVVPKSASGVAGTQPIDNDQWDKIVERVSAHLEAQGYKVDLAFSGEAHGQASFSSKQPPPEGTLSMTRDNQSRLRIVSSLKPANPELLISSFYETGYRHAVVTKSESAEHTKGLWEASKKYDDMTIELAPPVLEQLRASKLEEHQNLAKEVEEYMKTKSNPSRPSSLRHK